SDLAAVSHHRAGQGHFLAADVPHCRTPVHPDAVIADGDDRLLRAQPGNLRPGYPTRPADPFPRYAGDLAPDPPGRAAADATTDAQPCPAYPAAGQARCAETAGSGRAGSGAICRGVL